MSVGSPRQTQVSPRSRRLASLQSTAASNSGSSPSAAGAIVPIGANPCPVTSNTRPSGSRTSRTVSSLHVSVPVLSLAIIVQLPSPSTAASRRTITARRAIRAVATASATVIATGSPSGVAETASATAKRNISPSGYPLRYPARPTRIETASTTNATVRANFSSRISSGGGPAAVPTTSRASSPTAVAEPVATTSPCPRPRDTIEPAYAMFRRSASVSTAPPVQPGSLVTGIDSPERSDSSISSPCAVRRRRSAGTRFPDSRSTRSPGTRPSAAISWTSPSRRTVARISRSCWSARVRAPLLPGPDRGVEDQDQGDECGVCELANEDRDGGGGG